MYRFFLIIILTFFLFSGCGTIQKSNHTDQKASADTMETKALSEDDQLKYQFAFIEGMKHKALKNYSKAISYFYRCLEIQPNSPAVQYQISLVNNLLDQPDVSLRYGKKAVKNDPENKYYREHLFQLYLRKSQPKQTIKQYEYI